MPERGVFHPCTCSLLAASLILVPQPLQPLPPIHPPPPRRITTARGTVRHLVVLLPVPILYPKLPVAESVVAGISGALRFGFGFGLVGRRVGLVIWLTNATGNRPTDRTHTFIAIAGALARSSEMRDALRRANLPSGAVNQFMEADLLDDLK